jgi:DnaJ family protein C protein 28
MNRIVQRNGAAPPWVELQRELDTAVTTFRELLHQSYVRRVLRTLTALHPPAILATRLTLQDIKAHRDTEWEERERSYHDVAVKEINSLVRKYNGVARLYEDCAEDVLRGLKERIAGGSISTGNLRKVPGGSNEEQELDDGFVSFRDLLLGWADKLFARWGRKTR